MNPYFGRIGDVWKHLVLTEVVDSIRPALYLESHAGSAFYPLSHSSDRDFGVYAFLDSGTIHPALRETRYYRLLRGLPADDSGYPKRYPGSSALVMTLLGTSARYGLWDLDGESVRDLREAASQLGITKGVRISRSDGLDGVEDEARRLGAEGQTNAVVFIDPFDPFERSARGKLDAIQVARRLAQRGVPLVYWYGFNDEGERGRAWRALGNGGDGESKDSWGGEIGPGSADGPGFFQDGIRGCGVICLNCASSIGQVRRSASALVEAYREVRPAHSGVPGLRFEEFE